MKVEDKRIKNKIISVLKTMEFVEGFNYQIDLEKEALIFEFSDKDRDVFRFGYKINKNGSINWRGDTPQGIKLTLPTYYYKQKNKNSIFK